MEYTLLVVVGLVISIVAIMLYFLVRFYQRININSYSYEDVIDEDGNTITKVIDNNPESE